MKTRNLILICLLCFGLGLIIYPVIRPCKERIILDTDTLYVDRVVRDTIIQIEPVPYKVIQYDSIPVPVTVYKPVLIPIDTLSIVKEYLTMKYYSDTLKDDTEAYIRLDEKLYANKIFDRKLIYEGRGVDKIITNTIIKTGFLYGGSLSTQFNFELNVGYQSNSGIYIIGVDPVNTDLRLIYLRHF